MSFALLIVSAMLCACAITGTPVTKNDHLYPPIIDYEGQVSSPYDDKRMPDRIQEQSRLPSYDDRLAYRPQQQPRQPYPNRERMPNRYQQQMETVLSDLPHFAERPFDDHEIAQVERDTQETYAPLYRYKRRVVCPETGQEITRDHFYTTSTSVIGACNPGEVGTSGYQYDGIACIISTSLTESQHDDRGYRSLNQHWSANLTDHLYRFSSDRSQDLSNYRPNTYRVQPPRVIQEKVGYCSSSVDRQVGGASVALHRFYSPRYTDNLYTTDMSDPAAAGYQYKGVTCYVIKYSSLGNLNKLFNSV